LRLQWVHLDLERGVAKLLQTKTATEEYRQIPADALKRAADERARAMRTAVEESARSE